MKGFKFKSDTDWEAQPVKFLDDPHRVERFGVRFAFYVVNYKKNIEVQLNIRIHPLAEVKEKGNSHPYVVVYVVNQRSGAGVQIGQQEFERPGFYPELLSLSIEDWYRYWIERTFKLSSSSKILSPEMLLSKT